jgi:hypothetical protein
VTPNALAAELGVSGVGLRHFLRAAYPRDEREKWGRWELTAEQVDAARAHFGRRHQAGATSPSGSPSIAQAGSRAAGDWFWEGNVQAVLVGWLREAGWAIEFTANTAIREQGDDIRARRDGRVLRVEVKGWPSKGYADPARASETKRTQPSTQAVHWYSQAVLHVLRDLGRHPADQVAIGLPDWPRFRALIDDTEAPLRRLGVAVWVVGPDGGVEVRLPLA